MRIKIAILCIGCFLACGMTAQVIRVDNLDGLDLPASLKKQQDNAGVRWLEDILQTLREDGYLLADYQTIRKLDDTITVKVETGRRYLWARMSTDSIDPLLIAGAGLKRYSPDGEPVSYREVAETADRLLIYSEEHGYPFATVSLCALRIEDTLLEASLCLDLNRFIRFDSMSVQGNALLSRHFLEMYTGIKPGEPYRESLLRELDNRLDELSFVRRTQPTALRFSGDLAKPVIYLDERNASRFDLIVGFLPNNEITGRLVITGQGTLDLRNVFGQGERFGLQFSKLESTTKSLQSSFSYPFLPALPLGIDASFDLFLKDSTFLERDAGIGLLYSLQADHYIKATVDWYNSDVLTIDTASVLATRVLPPQLDVRLRSYGLEWGLSKLDYKPNPRSGWSVRLSGSAGARSIRRNAAILQLQDPSDPAFDYASLYDSLDERSLSTQYHYDFSYAIPLTSAITCLLRTRGAARINRQLFTNELFRIGGNQLLRGFDEQSISVSEYHMLTVEPRYLLSRNAYAGVFADVAWVADRSQGSTYTDLPVGFGAIFTFETRAGVFGLTYALGSRQDDPVLLRNGKIHFGYVNYF